MAQAESSQMKEYLERIRIQYLRLQGDSTALFEEILSISVDIGLERTLALLETCCMEKRMAWVAGHFIASTPGDADAVRTGFDWFYHTYLHARPARRWRGRIGFVRANRVPLVESLPDPGCLRQTGPGYPSGLPARLSPPRWMPSYRPFIRACTLTVTTTVSAHIADIAKRSSIWGELKHPV